MEHHGSCHCGAVTFNVQAPADLLVEDCNCSVCSMTGYLHLIVPAAQFELKTGHDAITTYTFNTGVAQHTFCKHCGVTSFYVPRSNPDGFSVNARCLDKSTIKTMRTRPFDGQHWEQNAAKLSNLSN